MTLLHGFDVIEDDHAARRLSFESNASRLFVPSHGKLDLVDLTAGENSGSKVVRQVSDPSQLDEAAEGSEHHQRLYTVRQKFSWGRFCVTLAIFTKLIEVEKVSSPFLDWTQAFGQKIKENQTRWRGFWGYYSVGDEAYSEMCYNIHHVERNGRDYGDPWSLRQTGIYHKFKLGAPRSCWILLQPTQHSCMRLEQVLHKYIRGTENWQNAIVRAHNALLTSMMHNWPEYIQYLGSRLDELDEKACFSRVGKKKQFDFEVTFADRQQVHRLQEKMRQCRSVLDSCIDVASKCGAHCDGLSAVPKNDHKIYPTFEMYILFIGRQRQITADMLSRSTGTAELVRRPLARLQNLADDGFCRIKLSGILNFRNDESVKDAQPAIQASLSTLQTIATQNLRENETLSRVAQQGQLDSKFLKVLTAIATIYLPASLIATMFSSQLINAVPINDSTQVTRFVIASQFWIYLVVTIPLMLLTGLLTLALEQKWRSP